MHPYLRAGVPAIALALFGLTGCGESTDHISTLVANPGRYQGHDVRVAGQVTRVYELPLGITNIAAYQINDNTGQIWVVSHAGAPLRGDRVGVKGRLEPITSLNVPLLGNILGDVIEEQQRHAR